MADTDTTDDTGDRVPTYPDVPDFLIETWNLRRRALSAGRGEALPGLDVDLDALAGTPVPPSEDPPPRMSPHARKRFDIRRELAGHSELAALNGLLIAHLRKARFPRRAPHLFRRIWQHKADALLAELPPRWLISSVITFGDHGETEDQRRIGLAMNVFFSLMKLYEFERLHSGQRPDQMFSARRVARVPLPLGMPGFSLLSGGLDVNLLAQIWSLAKDEPVAGRIACKLLDMLNEDPGTLFRRIALMRHSLDDHRTAKAARAAAGP
ncbi:hypothetical protein LHP98_04375 [Rhodobacter sp. Har01]|uniref:hypothetical protein n=1 Tax=Rhodobacter sp. Har01 TaxID=2883999 RepID=UPI001D0724B5|nr:hypothetical protein [Rhodobacter sp. Har01]MCB6177364.1 hypothetical protein [Rhodobacter sp. Har01]